MTKRQTRGELPQAIMKALEAYGLSEYRCGAAREPDKMKKADSRRDAALAKLESAVLSAQPTVTPEKLPTDRVNVVLAFAAEEAALMDVEYVTTAHLLLGILREGDGVAMGVLANLSGTLPEDWITLDAARAMTARLFGRFAPPQEGTP